MKSLRYGGVDYLGWGDFRVNKVQFFNPANPNDNADLRAKPSFDPAHSEETRRYSWGEVKVRYALEHSRLNLSIRTRNLSSRMIDGLEYEALAIRFPSKPDDFDGVTPLLGFNMGSPTVLRMRHGKRVVFLCNDDVQRPLILGFPWALDKPRNTLFPVRINTAPDPMYPQNVPRIHRPIAPGSEDTFHISLSFGSASAPASTVAASVFENFRTAYPDKLHWKDRRPIGQLILARSATGWRTNPRGWLLDPSIDVITPAGREDFRRRIVEWADHSIAYLQNLNAQGMITWDLEGQEFTQPTSYIGDPRLLSTLAPEMGAVADLYFKRFRDAGFRVGVCVRPQLVSFTPTSRRPLQTPSPDPAGTLIDKIRYARNRWGATLFYIDSNGDPAAPLDFGIIRKVAQALPDVLLIPEHKTLAYYSVSAPYAELRTGTYSTPETVLSFYRNAFSVINVTDGSIDGEYAKLQSAVEHGDAMLSRAWFADPAIDKVRTLYSYVK